jgi:hypothetical protein
MPIGVYVRKPKTPKTAEQIATKFWSHVAKSTGCWEWSGLLNANGYGRFALSASDQTGAHRFAWQLTNGPIPVGRVVMHSCDNRKCVRPDHLSLGTQRDNLRDASRKRRLPNQNKTHCAQGHPLTGDNVRPRHDHKGRACVTCARLAVQKSNRARRARGLR